MRGVIWGLIVSNVLMLAWLVVEGRQGSSAAAMATLASDSEGADTLLLIDEVDPEQLRAYGAVMADAGPQLQQGSYCAEIGSFVSAQQASNFVLQYESLASLAVRPSNGAEAINYRVYIPPFSSRDEASVELAQLRATLAERQIIIDSFLISGSDLENGISLGLFSEQVNALGVESRLAAIGINVQVREEPRQAPEIWVIASGFGSYEVFNQWWLEIAQSNPVLQAREKLCETIALPF